MKLLTLTNSSINTFRDCQMKYFFEYILRLSPLEEPTYFTWGHMVHRMAEFLDQGCDVAGASIAVAEAYTEEIERGELTAGQIGFIERHLAVLENMFTGHQLKYLEHDQQFEPLGAESKFQVPVETSRRDWKVLFMGKIDGLRRNLETGTQVIWERKTASATGFGDHYWEQKTLDSQPRSYLVGSHYGLGLQPEYVWYDVFIKPAIRQKKTETEAEFADRLGKTYLFERQKYFVRRPFGPFSKELIQQHYWDICNVAEEIIWHIEKGIWAPHHPGNRVGGCPYFGLCKQNMRLYGLSTNNLRKFRSRPIEEAHPELFEAEVCSDN